MNTSNSRHSAELQSSAEAPVTGQVAVGAAVEAFPDVAGSYVRFKAISDNAGRVFIHGAGSGDGWPLESGEQTGLLPVANLNLYEYSGATQGDAIFYEVIR